MTRLDMGVAMYYHLARTAEKYGISIGEVNIALTRWAAEQLLGFKCNHPRSENRISKRHRAYCRLCYTFMKKKDRMVSPFSSELSYDFFPAENFIDKILAERQKKEAESPGVGLMFDKRGGE